MSKSFVSFMALLVILQTANSATWKTYDSTNGLGGNYVNAIGVDAYKSIWVGTSNAQMQIFSFNNGLGTGVSRFDSNNWITYTKANGLKDNNVSSIAFDTSGNRCIATRKGVSIYNGTSWTTEDTLQNIVSMAIDKNNIKWFRTIVYCACVYPTPSIYYDVNLDIPFGIGTSFRGRGTTPSGLISNPTFSICVDKNNHKWFSSDSGIIECIDTLKTFSASPQFSYLSASWKSYISPIRTSFNAMVCDDQNNKWLATTAGVTKFDGTTWTTYTKSNGLVSDTVLSIAIDKHQNKWFGTTGGVTKFDGTTWTNYTTANGLANNIVSAIAIDSTGRKWFGTQGGGVSVLSDGDTPVLDKKSHFQPSNLKIKYSNGRLAIAIPEGISNTGTLQLYTANGKMVLAKSITSQESNINTTNLSPGLYLVRFSMGKTIVTGRFVK